MNVSENEQKSCFQIVTIGSATVDYFADTDSELIKIETRTTKEQLIAYPVGSKILINGLKISTGGGGTNCAATFGRLGLKTGFLGKIGTDGSGDTVIEELEKNNVSFIGAREGLTGMSVILDSIAKDRTILAYKGANNHLRYDEIQPFDTEWIYISSMLDESLKTVEQLVQKTSAKIAFNPSNYLAEQGYDALKPIMERTDILLVNREEACLLLGLDESGIIDIYSLLQKLSRMHVGIVVITNGAQGAYVFDGKYAYHAYPAENLTIVETTGAGDAFASTFVAARIMGMESEKALRMGMINSESVLTHKGAKESLLSKDALMAKLEKDVRPIERCVFDSPIEGAANGQRADVTHL